MIDAMEGEPRFPGIQRHIRDKLGQAGKGRRLPDDIAIGLGEARAVEELVPVQARRFFREIRPRPDIVGLHHILAVDDAFLRLGDPGFQIEDRGGFLVAVGDARQFQRGRDIGLIGGLHRLHLGAGAQIIVAAGNAQTALQQIGRVMFAVGEAGRHPDAEQIFGLEIGVVQGIDIGAQAFAQRAGQRLLVADRGDGGRAAPSAARCLWLRWPSRP